MFRYFFIHVMLLNYDKKILTRYQVLYLRRCSGCLMYLSKSLLTRNTYIGNDTLNINRFQKTSNCKWILMYVLRWYYYFYIYLLCNDILVSIGDFFPSSSSLQVDSLLNVCNLYIFSIKETICWANSFIMLYIFWLSYRRITKTF